MGSIAVIKLLKWLHFRLKTKFENRVQIDIKVSEFLTAFSQDTQLESGIFSNYHKFPLYEGDYDEKRLIRYIFKRYKNFTVWDQPMEKINWEIPCVYKGIPISFAHQKFGFRIYVTNELTENRAEKVSKEIQEILNKCLKLIKPEIRSAGLSALSGSEVIVLNKLGEIERTFMYFYKESVRKKKRSNIPQAISLSSPIHKVSWRLNEESERLADAAYIAFFSLIEHLCILCLAFSPKLESTNLKDFSKLQWTEKYKTVFPMDNKEFSAYYQKLFQIAKFRRNPASHGYLDKTNTIFSFYVQDARHRIPMNLYDRELIAQFSKNDINLETLVSFLKMIRKNPTTKSWMSYLDRGFDISYRQDSTQELRTFLSLSKKEMKEYLDYQSRLVDDHANMDW